jgi:hypothetical protein
MGTLRPEAVTGVRWERRWVVGGSAEMARREGVTSLRWVGGAGPEGVFEVDIAAVCCQLMPSGGYALHRLQYVPLPALWPMHVELVKN